MKSTYFTYMEKSSKDILDVPLILCTFDTLEELPGSSRETIKGETTLNRPVANEYYAKYSEVLSFEYALIKEDESAFTDEEQCIVEAWLTSPKQSQWIDFFDYYDESVGLYCGKFISTSWKLFCDGFAGVTFTFETNSNYAWRSFERKYSVSGSDTIVIGVESDEYEEWVYPYLTIYATEETGIIQIKNTTDNNNIMSIKARKKLPMYFDCQYYRISDGTTSGIVSFKDLGWDDVGSIYWLRLIPGKNTLETTGSFDLTINFKCPYKKVGGWI